MLEAARARRRSTSSIGGWTSVAEALQERRRRARWRDALAGAARQAGAGAGARRSTRRGRCTPRSGCTRCGSRPRSCATRLEIADESGAAPRAARSSAVKRVQDTLGRLHDLQVLQHHVAAVRRAPRRRAQHAGRRPGGLAAALEDECRHLHGRYVAALPALVATVDGTRRVVALLIAAARPSRASRWRCAARTPAPRRPPAATPAAARALTDGDARAVPDSPRRGRRTRRGLAGRLEASADARRDRAAAQGGARRSTRWTSAFDQIVTSPLVRTRQTADVFAESSRASRRSPTSDALAPAGTPGGRDPGARQARAQGARRAGRPRAEPRRARGAADRRAHAARVQEGRHLPHRLRHAAAEGRRHAPLVRCTPKMLRKLG